jgi:hypothetical protein
MTKKGGSGRPFYFDWSAVDRISAHGKLIKPHGYQSPRPPDSSLNLEING